MYFPSRLPRPQQNGIEESHFDVRIGGEADEQLVAAGRIQVVHQQTDANAADCGIAHVPQQQPAGAVIVEVV